MKKLSILLTVFIFSSIITSCIFLEFDDNKTKTFWAVNASNNLYRVQADLLAENNLVEVWAERGTGVTRVLASDIANEYRLRIYPRMEEVFFWYDYDPKGIKYSVMDYADVDNNGKLTILLLDLSDLGGTAGYFLWNNLFDHNNCDMIYINSGGWSNDPKIRNLQIFETIAHEMQHLLNFVTGTVYRNDENEEEDVYKALGMMDLWINEGLSEAAQFIYSRTFLDFGMNHDRLFWYLTGPMQTDEYKSKIQDGNNFFVWENHTDETEYALLDDYSTVNLFFNWLRIASGSIPSGHHIYFDILTSQFSDYRAVTTAAANRIHPSLSSWPILLGTWMSAMYINSSDINSTYGFKNQLPSPNQIVERTVLQESFSLYNFTSLVTPWHFVKGSGTHPLFSGEGVYSFVDEDNFTPPNNSGNIHYLGLGENETTNIIPEGGVLLTYNINTEKEEQESEIGFITGVHHPSLPLEENQSITSGARSIISFSSSVYEINEKIFRHRGRSAPKLEHETKVIEELF